MSDKVNLQKSYSAMNEKLATLFDESGVRRSFTVPYVEGQSMDEHVGTVGQVATQSGGLTNNLLTTAHHSTGKGWGSGDGHTVGHPSDKLRNTIIPKDDEHAKAAIDAAQKHLDNVSTLIGDDDPTVVTANNQLKLVKHADGAGMSLLDFGVMLTQLMYGPNQAVARAHSDAHPDGAAPHLRAHVPAQPEESGTAEAQGAPVEDAGAPNDQAGDSTAQSGSDASAAGSTAEPKTAPAPAAEPAQGA